MFINMPDTEKYFEEKFNRVFDKLETIHEQTKKTNGRVTKLEEEVVDIKLADKDHIIACPQNARITALDKEMEDVRFVIKHPKLIISGIIGLVILALGFAIF